MLLSFYFNELHQRIKNILFFKKTSNYRLFVNERGTKALLRWFSSIAFLFLQESFWADILYKEEYNINKIVFSQVNGSTCEN